MKEKTEFYLYYEKLMKMKLEQSIAKTAEYQFLADRYPHITESIRLKREMKRLEKKPKSERERRARFLKKREIDITRTKLRKEGILKRLHGESKQEAIFHTRFIINASKWRISSLFMRIRVALQKTSIHVHRLQRSMYRNLPPSVFDLKSLDRAETGLALRDWVQDRHKKRRKQKPFSL